MSNSGDDVSIVVSTTVADAASSGLVDQRFSTKVEQDSQVSWLVQTKRLLMQPEDNNNLSVQLVSAAADLVGTLTTTTTAPATSTGFCRSDDELRTCLIVGGSCVGGLLLLIVSIVLVRRNRKKKTVSLDAFLSTTEGSSPNARVGGNAASSSIYGSPELARGNQAFVPHFTGAAAAAVNVEDLDLYFNGIGNGADIDAEELEEMYNVSDSDQQQRDNIVNML